MRLEVGSRETQAGEAELLQRTQRAVQVVVGQAQPHIEIAGVARMPMGGQRIAADHQILNPA